MLKVIKKSRPVKADTWAIFHGLNIAKRHISDDQKQEQFDLATDIAETLQVIHNNCEAVRLANE